MELNYAMHSSELFLCIQGTKFKERSYKSVNLNEIEAYKSDGVIVTFDILWSSASTQLLSMRRTGEKTLSLIATVRSIHCTVNKLHRTHLEISPIPLEDYRTDF